MNRKRSQLQAYFAGILDGEGHIGINFNGSTFGCRVSVSMDDPQAILMFAREYPEARLNYRRHVTKKPYFEIRFGHYKAYRFLVEVLPFLLVKHEQAKVALTFLAHRRREHAGKHGGSGNASCERCQRLHDRLLAIRAEAKTVNSVNALLEHGLREYRSKPEDVEADVTFMVTTVTNLLEGLETKDRLSTAIEPISAVEQDIVQAA